jgi:nicotinate-nucleotide--dimethylbenzimidazole phosphoribosyltransferase
MLVEDDNNLREIYEARLAAEGYDIVAAQDGEAALAVAAKEHPDLVISDVMMPKISGFEMLDILRNTEALRDVKVIMLTALGQAEDNARAGALGADRYLVKSQVTLEDIVKATHDVLEGANIETPPPTTQGILSDPVHEQAYQEGKLAAQAAALAPVAEPTVEPIAAPVAVAPAPTSEASEPVAAPEQPAVETPEVVSPAAAASVAAVPVTSDSSTPADIPADDSSIPTPEPTANDAADQPAPVSDDTDTQAVASADPAPAADEESAMRAQIDQFLNAPELTEAPEQAEASAQIETPEQTAEEPAPEQINPDPESVEPVNEPAEAPVIAEPEQIEVQTPPEESLPDESDAELAKDDSTPDMGQLAVQAPPEAPVAEPETQAVAEAPAPAPPAPAPAAAPGYPASTYELPSVPGAAIGPQPQSDGDRVVSDAINDMLAGTPASQANPTLPPSQAAAARESIQPVPPSYSAPAPAPTPAPEAGQQPAPPYQPPAAEPADTRKRVIAPLGGTGRPDINQLLSLEEAKSAAAQAGAQQMQQPQPGQPAPQQSWRPSGPNQWGQARPQSNDQGSDPNSIAL